MLYGRIRYTRITMKVRVCHYVERVAGVVAGTGRRGMDKVGQLKPYGWKRPPSVQVV